MRNVRSGVERSVLGCGESEKKCGERCGEVCWVWGEVRGEKYGEKYGGVGKVLGCGRRCEGCVGGWKCGKKCGKVCWGVREV